MIAIFFIANMLEFQIISAIDIICLYCLNLIMKKDLLFPTDGTCRIYFII